MNTELQTAVVELINTFLATKDFVLEQAPDVIQEFLMWRLVYSLTTSLIIFLLVSGVFYRSYKFYKHYCRFVAEREKDKYSHFHFSDFLETGCNGFFFAILIMLGIIAACVCPIIFIGLVDALQIWIAPKVYLLEHASTIIKG